jgi:hypothetical protein
MTLSLENKKETLGHKSQRIIDITIHVPDLQSAKTPTTISIFDLG